MWRKMRISIILYRIKSWIKHRLTAWNSSGEGIHSPYLFYLVRMLVRDKNSYYCWQDIEHRRECMLRAPKLIHIQDYGSGGISGKKDREQVVSDIAKTSMESAKNAQLFFRIIVFLTNDLGRALQMVELGTNLGITTAYLAAANKQNTITTFEGSHELIEMAKLNWEKLNLSSIHVVEGDIDQTLTKHIKQPIDFAFLDANHTYKATWRYFDYLASLAHSKTIFAVDDIHYSPEMEHVWERIKNDERVTTTMDFYDFGLVFFDTHYIRKHYRLTI